MRICEASPASEAPLSAHAQVLRKFIMIVIALLILVTGFFLASASTATATPAPMNVHTSLAPNLAAPSCGGNAPGFCPNPNFGFAN